MKLDNPKLTAYALGELTPAEQAELEQELKTDREIATELEETREIARILRGGFASEPAGELAEHQRDAIFREAQIAEAQRKQSAPPANEVFAPLIVPKSAWWNRPGPWQAIAACAVAGFASYALFVNVGSRRGDGNPDGGDFLVQLPLPAVADGGPGDGPELISPETKTNPAKINTAGLDPLKTMQKPPQPNGISPEMKIAGEEALANAAAQGNTTPPKPKGPRVISNGDPETAERRAAASIGKKPGSELDEQVAAVLKERMAEASEIQPGTTYADFARVFQPVPGKPGVYQMIGIPSVKVDAEFATLEGQSLNGNSRLTRISKKYLE